MLILKQFVLVSEVNEFKKKYSQYPSWQIFNVLYFIQSAFRQIVDLNISKLYLAIDIAWIVSSFTVVDVSTLPNKGPTSFTN